MLIMSFDRHPQKTVNTTFDVAAAQVLAAQRMLFFPQNALRGSLTIVEIDPEEYTGTNSPSNTAGSSSSSTQSTASTSSSSPTSSTRPSTSAPSSTGTSNSVTSTSNNTPIATGDSSHSQASSTSNTNPPPPTVSDNNSTSGNTATEKKSSNTGAIIGGVVGGLLGAVILGLGLAYMLYKRRRGTAREYAPKATILPPEDDPAPTPSDMTYAYPNQARVSGVYTEPQTPSVLSSSVSKRPIPSAPPQQPMMLYVRI